MNTGALGGLSLGAIYLSRIIEGRPQNDHTSHQCNTQVLPAYLPSLNYPPGEVQ